MLTVDGYSRGIEISLVRLFTVSLYISYSPDGINAYGSKGGSFAGKESMYTYRVLKVVKPCPVAVGTLHIHLFRQVCCRMYALATVHSVTDIDGRTDGRTCTILSLLLLLSCYTLKTTYTGTTP